MQRVKGLWPIVLAGGEGRRLGELTRRESGDLRPKQFWSLGGKRSLLATTLDRAWRLARPSRVMTVVAAKHEAWWRSELRNLPESNIVVQPENRGTAVGLLLPLLRVLRRDPEARVVVLPSDHFVAEETVLQGAIRHVARAFDSGTEAPILLGISPDHPDPELGWLVPGPGTGIVAVDHFVEKPSRDEAEGLLSRGGLWNSFILVTDGRQLLGLFEQTLPDVVAALDGANCSRELERAYSSFTSYDFSRDVLQVLGNHALAAYAVPRCGWSDLGTPQRVAKVRHRFPMGDRPTGLVSFLSRRRRGPQDRSALLPSPLPG